MPKFSKDELEEIRRNTERIEKERQQKDTKTGKKGSSKSKRKRGKKDRDYSLGERLVGLILLLITIGITYLVMVFAG